MITDLAGSATGSVAAGGVVAAVCAAVFFGFGVAHYAGVAKRIALVPRLSPTTGLAAAWLGGGALLMGVAAAVLDADGGVRAVLGLLLGAAAVASWCVGLVAIFWLPRRLRPRWLRESSPQHGRPPRRDGASPP